MNYEIEWTRMRSKQCGEVYRRVSRKLSEA